jgi:hypothetical protein
MKEQYGTSHLSIDDHLPGHRSVINPTSATTHRSDSSCIMASFPSVILFSALQHRYKALH